MPREPLAPATTELSVRRSRFIATAMPVASVAEVEEAIAGVRNEHPNASHVVYAFLIGDKGTEQAGMSDAGEPRGTAARPMMDILRGSDIWNVVITVVRYFGGTKLGTGGLVHAYGDSARQVLEVLPTRELVSRVIVSCHVPYALHEPVERIVTAHGGVFQSQEYSTDVIMQWEMPEGEFDDLEAQTRDLSGGRLQLRAVTDRGDAPE